MPKSNGFTGVLKPPVWLGENLDCSFDPMLMSRFEFSKLEKFLFCLPALKGTTEFLVLFKWVPRLVMFIVMLSDLLNAL